jgi:class 3 adenylate cyclase
VEPEPASRTLIFLFTDVEGSTRLWKRFPHDMKAALERHDSILQACLLGAANTARGQAEAGLARVGDGMHLYQGLKPPPVFWPTLRAVYDTFAKASPRPI